MSAPITITFSASVEADGETKEVKSTATITAASVQTGKQTIGNSYEAMATTAPDGATVIIYNPSIYDLAVRLTLESYTTKLYNVYNVIAGGIFVIHPMHTTDLSGGQLVPSRIDAIFARTSEGTADVEYCIII